MVIAMILVVLAMIALIRKDWTINKHLYCGIMIALFSALVIYVYCFDPTPITRWDLLEHYKTIDLIKKYGWSYAWTKGEYKERYIVTLYFYIMSKMPNYRLLPVLPLVIDFSVYFYIFQDRMRTDEVYGAYPIGDAAFVTLAWITTFGMKLAISGIRCVCAVSLCALAIYWEAIKRERKATSYFLYFIAYGIHDFTLIIILVRMLMQVKDKKQLVSFMIFAMVTASFAIPVLSSIIPGPAMGRVRRYWYKFRIFNFIKNLSTSELSVILCMMLVMIYYAYINFQIYRKLHEGNYRSNLYYQRYRYNQAMNNRLLNVRNQIKHSEEDVRVIEFTSTLAVVSVVSCYIYVFMERLMYLVAYGMVMSIPYYRKWKVNSFFLDAAMILVMIWLWFFNDIYIFMVNETGVFFLAR